MAPLLLSCQKLTNQIFPVLHFDPSFCVPTLTTKNVNVRVLGKARSLPYMVWGYSFLFGSTYVRPRKWSKIHKYHSQSRKIYGIKILNKKEKLLKKRRKRLFNTALPLNSLGSLSTIALKAL